METKTKNGYRTIEKSVKEIWKTVKPPPDKSKLHSKITLSEEDENINEELNVPETLPIYTIKDRDNTVQKTGNLYSVKARKKNKSQLIFISSAIPSYFISQSFW